MIWRTLLRRPLFMALSLGMALLPVLVRCQSPLTSTHGLEADLYGNLYVLDAAQNTVTLLSKNRDTVGTVGGSGWQDSRFDQPAGVWARNGIDVFVADYGNHRIQRFDRGLTFISSLSTRESNDPAQRIGYPSDVALSRMGDLFICDTENQRIAKVSTQNRVELSIGGLDAGRGRLRHPTQLEIGPEDRLYVLDAPRVMVYDMFGNFLHEMYQGMFRGPSCLFADAERIMVLDDSLLYCFDAAERPAGVVRIHTLPGLADAKIRAFAADGNTLFFLAETGLISYPNPYGRDRIDKEEKSR
jgi:NHL repeat